MVNNRGEVQVTKMKKVNEVLFLSKMDIKKLLTSVEIMSEIEDVFRAKGLGEDTQEFKVRTYKDEKNYFYGIGCYVQSKAALGIKWTGIYKDNAERGLPLITGLVILNDPDSGLPLAVLEAGAITGIRTPAFSALAAKHLADSESDVIAIIGCGYQGHTHLQVLNEIFKIRLVKAYDVRKDVLGNFAAEMNEKLGVNIEPVESAKEAVKGSDVVCMLTTARETIVFEEWVGPGSFITGINSFYDLDPKLSKLSDKWVVGDYELDVQTIIKHEKQNVSENNIYGDLGEIIAGKKPGRERNDERIVFTHRGMPSLDVVTAKRAYEKAMDTNIGRRMKLF